MHSLFEEQRRLINYFFDTVDLKETEVLADKLCNCEGSIIFSGVGKSGIIAQKWATTFLSTGTKALFLSPTDALHGDIGILSEKDICIFISKSGETEELLKLVPYIRNKNASLISIVSKKNSKLESLSDFSIYLPMEKELCPFNLAPTTSSSIQLIFGDVLAVALMKKKNFGLSDYAKNHPSGSIGKKMILTVFDLMKKGTEIPLAKEETLLVYALHELSSKGCGCLLIVDDLQRLKGIFTDGDLRRSIEKDPLNFSKLSLSSLMCKTPRFTTPNTLAFDAMKKMEEDPKKLITSLPVLEEERVVGLIRLHDILQAGL